MKTIHNLAVYLLLIAALLHIITIFRFPTDPNAGRMAGFGILYFVLGILMYMNLKITKLLGLIIPLIEIAIGFYKMGVNNWTLFFTIIFALDGLIALFCLMVLIKSPQST